MKKLNLLNKLMYLINYVFAILLLLGFVVPLISPSSAPKFSLLSLAVPVLMIVNLLFVAYWLIGMKRHFLLSLLCLLLSYFISSPLYNVNMKKTESKNKIKVMNYNVRLFNVYDWIKTPDIPTKIINFIAKENPDVLCIQEYHPSGEAKLMKIYPYKYIELGKSKSKIGQAIYSKFKIVNTGSLDFEMSTNNAIFIDIVKEIDTIRIYNLHLESLGLHLNKESFGHKNSERLMRRLSKEFIKQQKQVEQVVIHKKTSKHPVILTGDFNNNAYSWAYKVIKEGMKDSFVIAGNGFGKTFDIKNFPMRIDFIFVDDIFAIEKHKNYNIKYSDHKPIMATVGF